MNKRSWNRVQGYISVELAYYADDNEVRDLQTESKLPSALKPFVVDQEADELVLVFSSTGWYDPGKIHAAPEDCHPPEGGDERTLVDVYCLKNNKRIELPAELQGKLFDLFLEKIDEEDIDTSDDDDRY